MLVWWTRTKKLTCGRAPPLLNVAPIRRHHCCTCQGAYPMDIKSNRRIQGGARGGCALLSGGRIDDRTHHRYLVSREATTARMLADHLRIRGVVDTVDCIIGDIALDP